MKKKIKPVILIMISFLLLQCLYGQVQIDMPDYLKQKFLMYSAHVPREEIFLQFDRDDYVSGEDLWFAVYLIDRQSFKPSLNSRIVYFELLNAVNRPVVQKRILITNGSGPGQVVLPDSLSTGRYTIRAYTNWMKNFLPYNCFEKGILVYNTLNTKEFNGKLNTEHITRRGDDSNFPEENKNKGINLKINNSKQDFLEILVNTDDKFRSESNNLIYVFIQTHGNINYVSTEKMTKETTLIKIPKADLRSGINQITIFNSKCEPVADKYIYTSLKVNSSLTIHTIDSCHLRDKITLEIDPGNSVSKALDSSNISVSVAPKSTDPESMDIYDYMVFGTEYGALPRNIINDTKINELSPEVIDSALLNVRSNWIDWKLILSDNLPHFKYGMEKEDNLLLGKLVTNDQQPVHSSELILMCRPGKEASFQYARTDNEGNFSFNIHIDEVLKDLIIMPDDPVKKYKIIIESSFSDRYLQPEVSVDSSAGSIPPDISKLIVNHQVQKIFGTSAISPPVNPVFLPSLATRFYGKPDIELILADFISLPVMNEIFFELIPGVSLKRKKSGYEISITYRIEDDQYTIFPCLMIDGVIIRDASLIANLDPELVERIHVIKERYLVGKYFFSGIVNVITRAADFSCVPLSDYMMRLPYRVIDPVRSFVSPDYSSESMKESRIPDYRNTLYWNPSVKHDKEGKAVVEFWSSDNKADYVINIQGINPQGRTSSIRKIIRVR